MAMGYGTLRADDIQRATAELKSRRAAIRARYDNELKQLETKIIDLEMLEYSLENFLSNYIVEDGPLATVADSGPTAEKVGDEIASEQGNSTRSETPIERSTFTLINTKGSGAAEVKDSGAAEVKDSGAAEVKDSGEAEVTDELVGKDMKHRVWTPTERALLALKRSA